MSVRQQIDEICDRFEAVWQQGDEPVIGEFVAQIDPAHRVELQNALLEVDEEYRSRLANARAEVQKTHIGSEREVKSQCEIDTVETDETLASANHERVETSDGKQWPDCDLDFLRPAELPDELGRLGNYRILEILGAGGMGIVFRAEDTRLERMVAVKVMKPSIAASRVAKERFLREAKATAAIEHDNIVSIYQVGEDNGLPFIAMRYLRGCSLQQMLQKSERADDSEIARIGSQIAAGLSAAHQQGLIHRDIKPDNIWIEDSTNRIKILDFGLARTHEENAGLTQSGMVVGTPKFMSPEQAKGEPVDQRCDLFSLGAVLYQLASGKPPFEGGNLTATLIAVSEAKFRPIDEVCPDLDPALSGVIGRLLKKNPDDRYLSASDVDHELAGIATRLQEKREQLKRQFQHAETKEIPRPVSMTSPALAKQSSSGLLTPVLVLISSLVVLLGALWAMGALGIFKVETKNGTLVVKVSNEDFETISQGKTVKLRHVETGANYTITLDAEPKTEPLRPGDYEFVVTNDEGFRAEMKRFEIVTGERKEVEVWWEPKNPSTTSANDDEAVGQIRGDRDYFTALREIGAHILLQAIDDDPILTPQVLSASTQLGSLDYVIDQPEKLGTAPVLMKHPSIFLTFRGPSFSDNEAARLSEILLQRPIDYQRCLVRFYSTGVTNKGIAALRGLKLWSFEIHETALDKTSVEIISSFEPTSALVVSSASIDDQDLSLLVKNAKCPWFHVQGNKFTRQGLQCLRATSFTVLNLGDNNLIDTDLGFLPTMESLEALYLNKNPITDAICEVLGSCPKLTYLVLNETDVTQKGIERLHKSLPQCHILWDGGEVEAEGTSKEDPAKTQEIPITDQEYFTKILQLGGEVGFYAEGDIVSPDVAAASEMHSGGYFVLKAPDALAKRSHLVTWPLVFLSFNGNEFTDEKLASLAGLLRQRRSEWPLCNLRLTSTAITSGGIAVLEGIKFKNFEIDQTNLNADGLRIVQSTNPEESLVLYEVGLDDVQLGMLLEHHNWFSLGIPKNKITGDGLSQLVGAGITRLNLRGNMLSDEDMGFVKDMPELNVLLLADTSIGDQTLDLIKEHRQLIQLDLARTNVTEERVQQLHREIPQCQIVWDGGVLEPVLADRE
ncbi:serine/threonine-protein kinase [Stieleria varia]|uniref:Serine/threonine-protein kinase PknB n=1 Tax=Stieleria varia TaxID=2528005 RepID=A0A5C6A2V4_9BACT|nr:serine/threonine-protein kinase [Stieleria varia]TWT92733.1 Serine/threonine-protein kinase PknB [Stieleria varia]